MCGVVGMAVTMKDQNIDYDLFRALMQETQIRGLHATGVAASNVIADETTFGASENSFLFKRQAVGQSLFDYPPILVSKMKAIVGHCRYVTSYPEDNQPIEILEYKQSPIAIAHNGVITQELPENWERLYGYKVSGTNDSELVGRALANYIWHDQDEEHPLRKFPNSSQAVVGLAGPSLFFWRNGRRPLYYTRHQDLLLVASTKDIIKRVLGNSVLVFDAIPGVSYMLERETDNLLVTTIVPRMKDLQHETL